MSETSTLQAPLMSGGTGPHSGLLIAQAGAALGEARAVLIVLHGRGGNAADMLGHGGAIAEPDVALIAPEAAANSWYSFRSGEPGRRRKPDMDPAVSVLGELVDRLVREGTEPARIALFGFSQGACVALQYAMTARQRVGAIIGFSGALIGDVAVAPAPQAFAGMRLLLGCSDQDPLCPIAKVRNTERVFRSLGADVTTRVYPGNDHVINADEVTIAREMLRVLAAPS